MIDPTLAIQLVRQLRISRDEIAKMEMSVEQRLHQLRFEKTLKDIERAIHICGDIELLKFFKSEMSK